MMHATPVATEKSFFPFSASPVCVSAKRAKAAGSRDFVVYSNSLPLG